MREAEGKNVDCAWAIEETALAKELNLNPKPVLLIND
jgi:hypothetical protein